MQKIRHISHYLFIGLIPFILLMFVNASVNKHSHKLPNGEIIVHSHPFQSSGTEAPTSGHNHSEEEYLFYGLLSNMLNLTLIVSFILIVFINQSIKKQLFFYEFQNDLRFLKTDRNKAPPISILF
ncbi:MAG: hypothetical protein K8R54_00135 [Bacteroidales bacterium]|nr:hypothetical protein [Bacteroidales bacterium]